MIGRVRGRRAFVALQREGRRTRVGALSLVYHPDAADLPCLAFSVARAVGPAVVRNRARRRLRNAFVDLARRDPELVRPGNYLVVVRSASWDYEQGATWLKCALQNLRP